ncbi:mechanosensitive ion channel family protein [Gammaproteobacteria bacterium AS21]
MLSSSYLPLTAQPVLYLMHLARLKKIISLLAICCLFFTSPAFSVQHQSEQSLEQIIQAASNAGAQVIIVKPNNSPRTIDNPDASNEPQVKQHSGLAKFRVESDHFRNEAQAFMLLLPQAKREMITILQSSSPTGKITFYFNMVAISLMLFGLGYLFSHYIYGKHIVGPWFIAKQIANPVGYSEKLPILVTRFLLGVSGILITMIIAYSIGNMIFSNEKTETEMLTLGYIYFAFAMINIVSLFWRMILSPYLPNYRIPSFHPENNQLCTLAAKRLYTWLWVGAILSIGFNLLISWLGELGVSQTISGVMNLYLTGITAAYSIAMVLFNRSILTGAILQGRSYTESSLPAKITAKFWAPIAILYFIIAWFDLAYDLIKGTETRLPVIVSAYIIVLTVIVVYALVSYIIEQFFQRRRQRQIRFIQAQNNALMEGFEGPLLEGEEIQGSHIPQSEVAKSSLLTFEDLATRVASLLAFVAGIYALLSVWDINSMLGGNTFLANSYDVIFILFFGYIAYNFFKIWIDKKIASEGGDLELTPGDEGGAGGASRLATLLPLFRNFLLVLIFVSVALIALTEMGINVAPLFAGAGVVGLAIGFGAQTLVRDVFSGAFFLFDDAFRKGEYIDLGEVKGTVEKVSVRSFQLRHHLGRLHTVPFGEIKFLTNYSRDWVMMKLPLRVTYDTDIEKVRKLVKKLGQQLLDDPEIGPQFLQPLKSQGVIEMQDSAMIIRVKFMTKPGDQWVIRKTVYAKLRELFILEGIKFAHKEVTVRLADTQLDLLKPEQKQEIAGAAALAAQEDLTLTPDLRKDDR